MTLSGVSSLPQFLAKSWKKRRKKKTYAFLCRIAAGAETAEFLLLSCAAAAPIAKMVVVVSNGPRVFKKTKTFPPKDSGLGADEVDLASCFCGSN